jgi:Leucine-rich repeat (LRR) protein
MRKTLTVLLAVLLVGAAAFAISKQANKPDDKSPANTTTSSQPDTDSEPEGINETSVDLSGKQLIAVPDEVLKQTNITSLNLSNNQIASLPAEIGKLTKLQTLNVENNRLESLPVEIGKLTNLKTFDLGNNRLKSLPDELGNLSGLEFLNLSGYQGPTSDLESIKSKLPNTEVKY